MSKPHDKHEIIPSENVYKVDHTRRQTIPLYDSPVSAGFASPAENYIEARLNLQDLCVRYPDMTHFLKARGESMIGAYIFPGSILIVDSTVEVRHGKIIVFRVEEGWSVKRYVLNKGQVILEPCNPTFPSLYLRPDEKLEILGVVTYILSVPPRYVRPS